MNTESNALIKPIKPTFAIFLDIDGVLYNCPNQRGVFEKVKELFPDVTDRYSNHLCSIAAAHFFDVQALKHLDDLIHKIEEVATVQVVISSSWRECTPLDTLKNEVFSIHNFSKYIVDKTIDTLEKGNFEKYCNIKSCSGRCRAAEIQHWLENHPEVTNYVVIDDYDSHLSDTFGKRFIQTSYSTLLTLEHALEILSLLK